MVEARTIAKVLLIGGTLTMLAAEIWLFSLDEKERAS